MGRKEPGECGTLLLVFYLLVDKDDIPLPLDPSEENLDNQTVFELPNAGGVGHRECRLAERRQCVGSRSGNFRAAPARYPRTPNSRYLRRGHDVVVVDNLARDGVSPQDPEFRKPFGKGMEVAKFAVSRRDEGSPKVPRQHVNLHGEAAVGTRRYGGSASRA